MASPKAVLRVQWPGVGRWLTHQRSRQFQTIVLHWDEIITFNIGFHFLQKSSRVWIKLGLTFESVYEYGCHPSHVVGRGKIENGLLLAAEDESHSLDQKESWVGGSWSGWREGAANRNLVCVAWRPPWCQTTSPMWKKSPALLTRKPHVRAASLLWGLHTVLGNLTVAELFVFSIPLYSSEKKCSDMPDI